VKNRGELFASKIGGEITGKVMDYKNNDNAIYLQMHLQKWLLYHQFCKGPDRVTHATGCGHYRKKRVREGHSKTILLNGSHADAFRHVTMTSHRFANFMLKFATTALCFTFINRSKYCYTPCFGVTDTHSSISSHSLNVGDRTRRRII
jgi:hypothetical protein